jgi:hypothetical protein
MRILNLLLTGLFALLMSAAVQARMAEKMITCLSIDTIHQIAPLLKDAKIDIMSDVLYYATMPYVDANGSSWEILSSNLVANNPKEAAGVAQKRGAKVTHAVYQNARTGVPGTDESSCLYYDGTQVNPFISIEAIYSYDQ